MVAGDSNAKTPTMEIDEASPGKLLEANNAKTVAEDPNGAAPMEVDGTYKKTKGKKTPKAKTGGRGGKPKKSTAKAIQKELINPEIEPYQGIDFVIPTTLEEYFAFANTEDDTAKQKLISHLRSMTMDQAEDFWDAIALLTIPILNNDDATGSTRGNTSAPTGNNMNGMNGTASSTEGDGTTENADGKTDVAAEGTATGRTDVAGDVKSEGVHVEKRKEIRKLKMSLAVLWAYYVLFALDPMYCECLLPGRCMTIGEKTSDMLLDENESADAKRLYCEAVVKLIHHEFEDREKFYGVMCIYLVLVANLKTGTQADVTRLYKYRYIFEKYEWDDPAMIGMKQHIGRCLSSMNFLKMHSDGPKFLGWLFNLYPSAPAELNNCLLNIMIAASRPVISVLSVVLFKAWEQSVGACRMTLEKVVQQWMRVALQGQDSMSSKARQLLTEFHRMKHTPGVMPMLIALYSPFIWRSLSCANYIPRKNAVIVLGTIFPFAHQEPADTYDRAKQKQNEDAYLHELFQSYNKLKESLTDGHPDVRIVAVAACCRLLAHYWQCPNIGSANIQLLSALVCQSGCERRQPDVRKAVVDGLDYILREEPLAHIAIAEVVHQHGHKWLNDKSPNVRAAYTTLLERFRKEVDIRFDKVAPIETLLHRVGEEYFQSVGCTTKGDFAKKKENSKVGERLAALLQSDFFNGTSEQQAIRADQVIARYPLCAVALFNYIDEKVGEGADVITLACKLFIMYCNDPSQLQKHKIIVIGILLSKCEGNTSYLELVAQFFTDENIGKLMAARPDLIEEILNAFRCIQPGEKMRNALSPALRSHPRLLAVASRWREMESVIKAFKFDILGVREILEEVPENRLYMKGYKHLQPRNLDLLCRVLKDPICTDELRKNRESLMNDAIRLLEAFRLRIENGKVPFPQQPEDFAGLMNIAMRLIIRLDTMSSDMPKNPVLRLSRALIALFKPAGAISFSNPECVENSTIDQTPGLMRFIRHTIEALGVQNVLYPDPQLTTVGVELSEALWYLSGSHVQRDLQLSITWKFLSRMWMKLFRPSPKYMIELVEQLFEKVEDNVPTDDDLRGVWLYLMLKCEFSPIFAAFLNSRVDPECTKDLEDGICTDPENPLGEKTFSWHPRITDHLYLVIPRFKSLYPVCYFDTPEGPGGPRKHVRMVKEEETQDHENSVMKNFPRVPVDEFADDADGSEAGHQADFETVGNLLDAMDQAEASEYFRENVSLDASSMGDQPSQGAASFNNQCNEPASAVDSANDYESINNSSNQSVNNPLIPGDESANNYGSQFANNLSQGNQPVALSDAGNEESENVTEQTEDVNGGVQGPPNGNKKKKAKAK